MGAGRVMIEGDRRTLPPLLIWKAEGGMSVICKTEGRRDDCVIGRGFDDVDVTTDSEVGALEDACAAGSPLGLLNVALEAFCVGVNASSAEGIATWP